MRRWEGSVVGETVEREWAGGVSGTTVERGCG